ncbi:Hypothetical_protein [Hexamita inflata]|uniref:Hypothetical_protein n=1 Tax=Hexamita inflata TaxID=28002 RepID=A0ABP1L349_9EUKA
MVKFIIVLTIVYFQIQLQIQINQFSSTGYQKCIILANGHLITQKEHKIEQNVKVLNEHDQQEQRNDGHPLIQGLHERVRERESQSSSHFFYADFSGTICHKELILKKLEISVTELRIQFQQRIFCLTKMEHQVTKCSRGSPSEKSVQ